MKKVNTFEIKARLALYLDRAARGERIVIQRYNEPVAELVAIEPARTEPRRIGPVAGRPTFDLLPSFFEPLDDGDRWSWEGLSAGAVYPPLASHAKKRVVAAKPPATPARTARRRAKRKRS